MEYVIQNESDSNLYQTDSSGIKKPIGNAIWYEKQTGYMGYLNEEKSIYYFTIQLIDANASVDNSSLTPLYYTPTQQ